MDKLLITIEVPAVGQIFDITVPESLSVEMLIGLLYQLLRELGSGMYVPSGTEVLCRREDRRLLSGSRTLKDNDIQMGDHLLLF